MAQTDTTKVESGNVEVLFMLKATKIIQKDKEIDQFEGDVVIRHDDITIFCDYGTIEGKIIRAHGNVVIRQGDTLNIFGDRLYYDGYTRIADLENRVVLQNRDQRLYTERMRYDVAAKIATYFTGATLTNGKTYLKSRQGSYHVQTDDAFFRDSVLVVDPEFNLKTEDLQYNTASKTAFFRAPTIIRYEDGQIYTEGGYYKVDEKFAVFDKNPQYRSDTQRSRANRITYDGVRKEILLEGESSFEEGDKVATADRMIFFEQTDQIELHGNASYRDEKRQAKGETLLYDRKSGRFRSPDRTVIYEDASILEADLVDYDDASGLGRAEGKVYWKDTVQNIQILTESADYDQASNYIKAWGCRPVLMIILETDTLFVAADTLLSFSQPVDSSAHSPDSILHRTDKPEIFVNAVLPFPLKGRKTGPYNVQPPLAPAEEKVEDPRFILAYHQVRIYKSDLRGICDSLYFDSRDSIFHFFGAPVMWSDSTQFSADTMHLHIRARKVERMDLNGNALILVTPNEEYYDQIRGKEVNVFFSEGSISEALVTGNAETIYYVTDESGAYSGVNQKQCSRMRLFFAEKKLDKIRFYDHPSGKFLPMGSTDHKALRLQGFRWLFGERPLSALELSELCWVEEVLAVAAPAGEENGPTDVPDTDAGLEEEIVPSESDEADEE